MAQFNPLSIHAEMTIFKNIGHAIRQSELVSLYKLSSFGRRFKYELKPKHTVLIHFVTGLNQKALICNLKRGK